MDVKIIKNHLIKNIAPESNTQDLYDNDKSPTGEDANPVNKNNKSSVDTSQKPKAIMPKKEGGGNRK